MINGQRPGPSGPGSSQQLPAHPIQLADVARKLRSVPKVEGALSNRERQPCRCGTSASSMQSPPASADATRVSILSPGSPAPAHLRGQRGCRRVHPVPGGPAQHWPPGGGRPTWMRSGCSDEGCSSFRVGLVSAQHFLTLSARRYSYLFGGLGVRAPRT